MGRNISRLMAWLERRSGWLLGLGLAAAVWVNARQWRLDRQAAQRLNEASEATTPLRPPTEALPRVSLLIPAWNEAEHLEACLRSVLALRYPNKEAVVCAGGEDGTLYIARRFIGPGVTVMEQLSGEGKQPALQRCFEHSSGEIIFLTDADCRLEDDCFERTLAPIVNGLEVATTGSRRPFEDQQNQALVAFQWADHLYQEGHLPDYIHALFGINAAIRRDVLEKAGAFTAQAAIGTDLHLAHRLMAFGYRIRYVRDSRVYTDYLSDPSAYIRQQSRWFRNRFLYGLRDRAWGDVLSHLRAGLAAVFMLGAPLAGGLGSRLLWRLWIAAASHLALSQVRLACYAHLSGALHIKPFWRYFSFIPYMVVGWVAIANGLLESLIPMKREKW